MAQLTIIYDETEPSLGLPRPDSSAMRIARLSLADDLSETDIYLVARTLAELLLEQLAK
jgi:hypothetical protein